MTADLNLPTAADRFRLVFDVARGLSLVLTVAFALSCRPGVPVVDPSAKPPTMDGTVSGRVSTVAGTPVSSRKIELVEVTSGARHSVSTDANGAFTVKVPPGKYRLDVELRAGERIERGPGEIDINKSDLDSNIQIVITRL